MSKTYELYLFHSDVGIFGMRCAFHDGVTGDSGDVDGDDFFLQKRRVTRHDRIDDFLVERPNLVPFHHDDGSRSSLSHDELLQPLYRHTSTQDAAHRRHPRIVPAVDQAFLNEPRQLALGQNGVLQVQSRVLPNVDATESQGVDEPEILIVPVVILGRTQRVRNALDAVHDRTCEIVGRVN